MPKPPRQHPEEYASTGFRIDWTPFTDTFVAELIEITGLQPIGDYAELANRPTLQKEVATRLNELAIFWRGERALRSRPTDHDLGKTLGAAAAHAEKLVDLLPVVWDEDDTWRNEEDDASPPEANEQRRGVYRFQPTPSSCNPRLADALQLAIERHVSADDGELDSLFAIAEWPANLMLQLRGFAEVLRAAENDLKAPERKQKPSSQDVATVNLAQSLTDVYFDLFCETVGTSKSAEQQTSGPWVRFLGMVLRELPGLETIDDKALENLTYRHLKK